MKHTSNIESNVVLKIGRMLGVTKKDIYELRKTSSKQVMADASVVSLIEPANSYKDTGGGYYSTISIKDFQ
ncbi:MAG: hypothetical protein ACOC80_12395 [Petrotogales bacterium]